MAKKESRPLILSVRAKAELEELLENAAKTYSPKRANKVADSLFKEMNRIANNPFAFPIYMVSKSANQEIRSLIVERKLRIVYKIRTNKIIVLHIIHAARNPDSLIF